MKSIYLVTFGFLFLQCKECQKDIQFEHIFYKNIKIIEHAVFLEKHPTISYILKDTVVVIDEFNAAVSYLNKVSGLKQDNLYLDNAFPKLSELSIGLKKWKKWYDENKCTMTVMKADSLIFE